MGKETEYFGIFNEILIKSKSTEEAIGGFLRILVDIYQADRVRIFEVDNDSMLNSYVESSEEKKPTETRLFKAPRYMTNKWFSLFDNMGSPISDSIECFRECDELIYDTLKSLDITHFVAAPLQDFEDIVGYVVVENPHVLQGEIFPLSVGSVFIRNEILRKNNDTQRLKDEMKSDLLEKAILFKAYSFFRANLSTKRVYSPIIELIDGKKYDYSNKFGEELPKYDEMISQAANAYVDVEDRDDYKHFLSSGYLIEQYLCGEAMPEYTCRIWSSVIGWHYRKYVIYMAKDTISGDILALIVAYNISDEIIAKQQKEEDRKKLEKALKEAELANESKTKFLFNMSHDVRTPLNAVMGFIGMAKRNIEDRDRVLDCLNKMETSGKHLVEIVNDVLKLSRIEAGQQEIATKPISIGVGATELEVVFMPAMEEKHIFFETGAKNIRDFFVYADQPHINQVIFNVMSNAIKYTPEGGKITYSFEQLDDLPDGRGLYRWTIADTGIGMSEEFVTRIFERFSRERTTTESGIEGTGLGMSLVHELVELMGGTIEVKSRKGQGTTVSFEIPLYKATLEEVLGDRALQKNSSQEDILRNKRILMVEDNELNREIARDLLEMFEVDIEEAQDGDIAVDMLKEKGPDYYDLILMDIQMPRMDGYTATKTIREMFPQRHIPIVGLSANAFDENKAMSLEAGMDDHVGKPINVSELKRVLCTYI